MIPTTNEAVPEMMRITFIALFKFLWPPLLVASDAGFINGMTGEVAEVGKLM